MENTVVTSDFTPQETYAYNALAGFIVFFTILLIYLIIFLICAFGFKYNIVLENPRISLLAVIIDIIFSFFWAKKGYKHPCSHVGVNEIVYVTFWGRITNKPYVLENGHFALIPNFLFDFIQYEKRDVRPNTLVIGKKVKETHGSTSAGHHDAHGHGTSVVVEQPTKSEFERRNEEWGGIIANTSDQIEVRIPFSISYEYKKTRESLLTLKGFRPGYVENNLERLALQTITPIILGMTYKDTQKPEATKKIIDTFMEKIAESSSGPGNDIDDWCITVIQAMTGPILSADGEYEKSLMRIKEAENTAKENEATNKSLTDGIHFILENSGALEASGALQGKLTYKEAADMHWINVGISKKYNFSGGADGRIKAEVVENDLNKGSKSKH